MYDINSICEGNKITNNFTEELNSLGEVVTTKLLVNEIDYLIKIAQYLLIYVKNLQ